MNIVQILCIHVCKWKRYLLKVFQEEGKRGMKENGGKGKFKYGIL
jgi:hypothetical protein